MAISFAIKCLRFPLLIPAALTVLTVRLLGRSGTIVRFGNFYSGRIGHLVGNSEIYLCERDAGQHPYIDIWTHYGEVCSSQIDKMLRRVMRVWPSRFTALVMVINKMFPGWERHDIGSKHMDRDPEDLLIKYPSHLKFTPQEIRQCEAQLRKWGVNEGDQWVCLMVRDGVYLQSLSYHSYRDSDINDYTDAALALAERGYHVFRMGAKMEKPFAATHARIHDFPFMADRSELMSVYLGARCAFCVSTSTGWDAIPQAFRRPMCYVNFVPFEYMPTWLPNSLLIWKHHLKATLTKVKAKLVDGAWQTYTDSGKGIPDRGALVLSDDELTEHDWKRMSISEIAKSDAGKFMRAEQFTQAGIMLQNNTPTEIKTVALEMASMVEGKFHPGSQTEFWDVYPRSNAETGYPLHGEIRMRIGVSFLQEQESAEREEDSGSDSGTRRLEARTA